MKRSRNSNRFKKHYNVGYKVKKRDLFDEIFQKYS